MTEINRRDALKALGVAPLAGMLDWSKPSVDRAARFVAQLDEVTDAAPYKPKFFNAHEWRTVRVLADIIIPKDERSGSATDAKAPEFIDYMIVDADASSEANRVAMRGGLAWLDNEMRARFGKDFISSSDAQRRAVLDDVAYPARVKPEFRRGATWFGRFRSSVGSAFFSSQMGWQDLRYMGNVFNPNWNGCPKPATDKLGVSYEEYDASMARFRASPK